MISGPKSYRDFRDRYLAVRAQTKNYSNLFRIRIFLFLSYSFGIETINTFMHSVVPSKTIPDSRPKWAKCTPAFRPKRRKKPPAKTLPDRAAHTYMACIREYPPGPQLFSPWGPSRKKNDGYARRLSSGSRRPTYSSTLYDGICFVLFWGFLYTQNLKDKYLHG